MLNPIKFLSKFIKSNNQKQVEKLKVIVEQINNHEKQISQLQDKQFPKKTEEFKNLIKNGEKLEKILPEAFALVREASKRTRKERHYDVQIMGGIVLHNGGIAEMKTGEGKTITIALARKICGYLLNQRGDSIGSLFGTINKKGLL